MRKIRINLPLVWLVVGLFCLIEFLILVRFHQAADQRWRETYVFGASLVAGAFGLYSYMKAIEEQRSERADRLIERWNNPSLAPLKTRLRAVIEQQLDPLTMMRSAKGVALAKEILDARADIIGLLGFFEEMALAVKNHTADEGKLNSFFRSAVGQSVGNLQAWIENERKVDNEYSYYVELEWLAGRWKK
jgi:Domain of unknown function (DUF4760)